MVKAQDLRASAHTPLEEQASLPVAVVGSPEVVDAPLVAMVAPPAVTATNPEMPVPPVKLVDPQVEVEHPPNFEHDIHQKYLPAPVARPSPPLRQFDQLILLSPIDHEYARSGP